jgi:hypothetical protein
MVYWRELCALYFTTFSSVQNGPPMILGRSGMGHQFGHIRSYTYNLGRVPRHCPAQSCTEPLARIGLQYLLAARRKPSGQMAWLRSVGQLHNRFSKVGRSRPLVVFELEQFWYSFRLQNAWFSKNLRALTWPLELLKRTADEPASRLLKSRSESVVLSQKIR